MREGTVGAPTTCAAARAWSLTSNVGAVAVGDAAKISFIRGMYRTCGIGHCERSIFTKHGFTLISAEHDFQPYDQYRHGCCYWALRGIHITGIAHRVNIAPTIASSFKELCNQN
jgi:hypothetical protein